MKKSFLALLSVYLVIFILLPDRVRADGNEFEGVLRTVSSISMGLTEACTQNPQSCDALSRTITRFPGLFTALTGAGTVTAGGLSYAVSKTVHTISRGLSELSGSSFDNVRGFNDSNNDVTWFGRDFSAGVMQIGEKVAEFGLLLQSDIEYPYWRLTYHLCPNCGWRRKGNHNASGN